MEEINEANSESNMSTSQAQTSQQDLQASSLSIPISLVSIKPPCNLNFKTTQPRTGRAINNYGKTTQL